MFCEKLKEQRLEKGYTLAFVAKELNLTIRSICRYESGEREPSISMLKKICEFYDVSSDYLIGLTDNY